MRIWPTITWRTGSGLNGGIRQIQNRLTPNTQGLAQRDGRRDVEERWREGVDERCRWEGDIGDRSREGAEGRRSREGGRDRGREVEGGREVRDRWKGVCRREMEEGMSLLNPQPVVCGADALPLRHRSGYLH